MKILITTDFYLPFVTGVTTVMVNELAMLPGQGHEVRLLTIGDRRESYYQDGVYHMHSSRLKPMPDSYMTCSYIDPLLSDIYSWKPDLIHSNNEFFSMGYAKRIASTLHIPLVHTCHTNFTRYSVDQRIRHSVWDSLMAGIVRSRITACDLLISPSEEHKEMLLRYRITKPVVVLPSGIDLRRFGLKIPEEERKNLRAGLGFQDNHCVLVSVSRLSPEKRINHTIDAFFLLSLLEPSARLLIVGGGPKEESLKHQVKELGLEDKVVFTGSIPSDQVHIYYQLSDIFVSSSIRESQGLGFVEAMASSLPVLLCEDGSLGFSIEEEGCGFLYHDERGFVSILTSLVNNRSLINEMGLRAKAASSRFSLENWAIELSSVCTSIKAKFSFHNGNKADY